MKEDLVRKIELPEGVAARLEKNILKIQGPKGEVSREFVHPKINIKVDGQEIVLEVKKSTKREKKMASSFAAHIRNIVKGVQEPFVYRLKICSGHFPMNVSVSGKEFVIKNFLGESVPRKVILPEGAEVKVQGDQVEVISADKEVAGLAAAKIEHLGKVKGRDLRIFMDGIWLIHKAGKDL